MIRTLDELRLWIDAAPVRHAKVGAAACACGWVADSYGAIPGYRAPTWDDHVQDGPIFDLCEYLSPEVEGMIGFDGSLSDQIDLMQDAIDCRDQDSQQVLDVLLDLVEGTPRADYQAVLTKLICSVWPGWGRDLPGRPPSGE